MTVTPVNDDPVANDDAATVARGQRRNAIDVLANDTLGPDAGETLTVTAVTQGGARQRRPSRPPASATRRPPTTSGSDSFTYTISDGNGGTRHGRRSA